MCLAFKQGISAAVSQESPLILTNVNTEGVKTKHIWLLHAHTHACTLIHTCSNEQIKTHSHTFHSSHMLYILCVYVYDTINTHILWF